MHTDVEAMLNLEAAIGSWVRLVGVGIDIFGVGIILAGIIWSTVLFIRRHRADDIYHAFKVSIGRSLLLGLEVLVAADIVKTIAIEPSFISLGVLGGLVLIRTFLGWTLVLEIEGRWPWQAHRVASSSR